MSISPKGLLFVLASKKHSHYLNDEIILELVISLDGLSFPIDSSTDGIDYYAADITRSDDSGKKRTFRLIWLIEGNEMEILGVINAYRRKNKKGKKYEKK